MTRLVHHESLAVADPGITLTVIQREPGRFAWFYSRPQLFLRSGATVIRIGLNYFNAVPDQSTARVSGYASTGFNGDTSPVHRVHADPEHYVIEMQHNQIVDFGLFVEITSDGVDHLIFCDPQASNDPR